MTVQELISKLEKFPKDYVILVAAEGDFFDINRIISCEKGYVEVFLNKEENNEKVV